MFRLLFLILLAGGSFASGANSQTSSSRVVSELSKPIFVNGLEHLSPDEVLEAVGAKKEGWFFSKEYKIPCSLLDSIEDNLRGYLDSRGYYNAKFKVTNLGDRVKISIKENKPVVVNKIEIQSDYPIRDLITFSKGQPFDTGQFVEIKKSIKRALLRDSYCSYNLSTKALVDLENRVVDLKYSLKKGGECLFGETKVGKIPKDISPDVILSRIRYKEGEPFTLEKINESYASINELGCFSSVVINTDKKIYNQVTPEIDTELSSKLNRTTLSMGYDTEVGWRVKGEYNRFNFLGNARKLGLSAEYSSSLKKFQATFLNPAILNLNGRYFDLRAKGGYKDENFDSYQEHKSYFDVRLNHISGKFSFDAGIGIENIDIYRKSDNEKILEGNFALTYPYLSMVYDNRDSKLDPKNGTYFASYLEYGLPIDSDSANYYKWTLEGRAIKTVKDVTFAVVGKAGVIDEIGGGDIPASKLFYGGGSYSNRAYGNNDIGITDSKSKSQDLGGHTWLNFTFEMDFPIYDEIGGALFYDTTMISEDSYDFTGQYIGSAGFGLRYGTPLGPLKLDFGFNVDDPSINRVSVQIGQSF